MRNPLIKRFPRELKSEFGKYGVIFLFIAAMISFVSGFLVANDSMSAAYDEGFEKYNIEDGNFELYAKVDDELIEKLEEENLTLYENFYTEQETKEVDSTLRIFEKRDSINLECLMYGAFPQNDNEIAIDRMYADNNGISVGDTLTVGKRELTVSGLVSLSDYSALFSSTSDMMFDAVKFGVAIMTEEGFESFDEAKCHYSYSWKYDKAPADDAHAKEMSEDFLTVLAKEAALANNAVTNYIPAYSNQAIIFTGEDIKGDNSMITAFLYIVIVIIAFIFAITTSNIITKEATVIGTLRASGYSKGELVRHYMALPVFVLLAAAVIGNILGYTVFKDIAADMYYGSYSLPTFTVRWNVDAFIKTTLIPLLIMLFINFSMLIRKLSLSPLKFIRRDLSRSKKKKAFRLNTKIGIMKRFRVRIIFQNMPNYLTIVFGIFFANVILLFGFMFTPLLDKYQEDITSNMLSSYQYVLKTSEDTAVANAEKYSAGALNTIEGTLKSEEVLLYGIDKNSQYIHIDFDGNGVYISDAYAKKHGVAVGDTIKLKEEYGSKEYSFEVEGIYDYPAALAIFMDRTTFNETFDYDTDYFNGYFSSTEITDLDENNIATVITQDDLTKTSRQIKVSMGDMMNIFLVFGIVMFMLIIYLLSKIIIEKNAQSISMTKILGYTNGEINGLYILTTSIVVILSLLVTIPIVNWIMKKICVLIFSEYSGWLPYYVPFSVFVKMAVMGILAYALIAFMQTRKVKRIPLGDALKNVE